MKTVIIDNFSGGISGDDRLRQYGVGSMVKNFKVLDNRLIPNRSMEEDNSDGSTDDGIKQYDLYHPTQVKGSTSIYALGKTSAGYPKIIKKTNATTSGWTLPSTAEGSAARITGSFIEWQDAFWMFSGTTNVSKWAIGGTFTDTVETLGETINTVAHSVIGADDNMYMFYNAKVVRVKTDGTVEDDVCTALPSNMRITTVAKYGTYLAIGMTSTDDDYDAGISQVFLWDMVTDTTVSDVIDWGEGTLTVLANVEGRLVGVSGEHMSNFFGLNFGDQGGTMVIKIWSGGLPKVYKSISTKKSSLSLSILSDVIVKQNTIYFVANLPFNDSVAGTVSTYHRGIYSFGRKDKDSNFLLNIEITPNASSPSSYNINSFGNSGDFWIMNTSNDGTIETTSNSATFKTTSSYVTQMQTDGFRKKLIAVGVRYLPYLADPSAYLYVKYKKDEETDYTTILKKTIASSGGVAGGAYYEVVLAYLTDEVLPEFREIKFKIESTGGIEVHGLVYKYEDLNEEITG